MTLRVTNTLTGDREPFEPQDPDDVLLYVCGLTVSDDPHLGHARTWVHADVFHRWLAHLGYDVRHVENVTDVNEKIVARVGEGDLGDDEAEVAERFTGEVIEAMRALDLLRAEVYPRVSEHVPEIIDLAETLVEKGYAYESGGSVYFDVTEFPEYGKLSNQDVDEIEPQGQDDERAEKRHPQDFALWKAGPVDEDAVHEHSKVERGDDVPRGQTWDSPWGEGRPGWHVECSAMSMTHLGETLDVHVGGQDLVFPHHENEIAQSEAATGEQFSRYWLHVRLLDVAGDGEKMSSSLENFTTVREAVDRWGTDAVRMFLLSTTYANRQTFSGDAIAEAEERWERLERAYERATDAADSTAAHTKVADEALRTAVDRVREEFHAAMNDDFNTRVAIAELLDLASAVHRHVDESDDYDYRALADAIETFDDLGGAALGFSFNGGGGTVELADDLVELVLELREEERGVGNYERADELRDRLEAVGVGVEDTDQGPTFRLD
jgi:cysteinyl-tRNA synthetase